MYDSYQYGESFQLRLLALLIRRPEKTPGVIRPKYFTNPVYVDIAEIVQATYKTYSDVRLSKTTLLEMIGAKLGRRKKDLGSLYRRAIDACYKTKLTDESVVLREATEFSMNCRLREAFAQAEKYITDKQYDQAIRVVNDAAGESGVQIASGTGLKLSRFPGAGELADMAEQSWWIHGLVPGTGVTLIVGRPDSCKSWLALLMARCSSNGLRFCGREVQRRFVFYIDGENGRATLRSRCEILDHMGIRVRFWCVDDPQGPPPPIDDPIYGQIAKKYRPVFIFDPLREFYMGAGDVEVNIESAVIPTIRAAKQLSHEYQVPVIVIHHSSDKDRNNQYLHSTHIRGAIDAGYFVEEEKADQAHSNVHRLGMTPIKARGGTKVSLGIKLDLNTGEYEQFELQNKQRGGIDPQAIIDLHKKNPSLSEREIAKKLRCTRWQVQKTLKSL